MTDVISIIIPVYNSEKFLKKNIESVLNQTYENLDIVIINDGSTDESEKIINEFIKNDKRIRYYKISNHGVSYARNYGIKRAVGKYICFIDSDDIVSENFCEYLYNGMISNDAELSVCNYVLINKNNYTFIDNNYKCINYELNKYSLLFDKFKGFLCNKMYITDVIKKNTIFLNESISMCEDLLFNANYLKYTKKIAYSENKLYGYVIDDNSSRKINIKWYSIFKVYKELFNNYQISMNQAELDVLNFNYLNVAFEAKVRSKIQKFNLKDILSNEEYTIYNEKIHNWRKLLKSNKISKFNKIKLIMYFDFWGISYFIKRRKLLGGK